MKVFQLFPLLVALASAVAVPSPKVNFDGTKVIRVAVGDDVAAVDSLINRLSLSVLDEKPRKNKNVDLLVPAEKVAAFEASAVRMDTRVMNEDIGAAIAREARFESRQAGSVPNITWFNSYHSYEDHMAWLVDVQATFAFNAGLFTFGETFEGRPLTGIHIWGVEGPSQKPAIIFHGTIHAREWITTMTVEYLIYQLLTLYGTDEQIKAIVDSYDFYIVPIANPDGFAYTISNDRFWRKNRQPNTGSDCVGTDNNRNWDAFWDVPGGSTTNPCDEIYRGEFPGSSPENKAHMDFLLARANEETGLKLFIDWHSFSQFVLTPWAYTCNETAPAFEAHQKVGLEFAGALKEVHGTNYTVGPGCQTLYPISGGSYDFAYTKAGAEYAFLVELRDTGTFGFDLPPEQILPTGEESFAGLVAMLESI